jgi:hypothetical protein
MKKEDSFDAMLNQVGPIVAPAHVSQFVPQDVLGRFKARICWQEDHGLKKT